LLFRDLSNAFILDVGKDGLTPGAKKIVDAMPGLVYMRLDITREIIQFVSASLAAVPLSSVPQRTQVMIKGSLKNAVSGGFPGSVGDLVVDNALDPKFILGYIGDDSNYVPDPGVVVD